MLKKIALVLMLALPMGVFAQNLKFGHINAQEIVSAMPEFAKAQSDIEALDKQLTSELRKNSTRNIRNSSKLSLRTLFLLTSLREDKKNCRI